MHERLESLDPRSAVDVDAIRSVFQQRRQVFEPELCDLARRVSEASPDEELRVDALNVLACAAVVAGDDEEGSRLFREALEATWGTGSHAERVACINLAMIVARERRVVEAFALSRRACSIALETGDPLGICLAHAQLAKVLLELEDLEGFAAAVEVAERHRPRLDDNVAGWVPHLLASLHAEVAVHRGDMEAARLHMRDALDDPDTISEVVDMGRARFLRRVGEPRQALSVIRRALGAGRLDTSYRIRFQAEELLCLIDLDDRRAVVARAADCLDEMARSGRACGSAIWRMRVGEAVGRALEHEPEMHRQALQAFELAAVAALERSWESRQFFREFPQLEKLEPEDLARIEAHGERFQAEHRELASAIRTLLLDGARFEASLAGGVEQAFFVSACAWCNRVRGPERTWLPLDELARGRDLDVTHGICEDCTTGLVAEATAARDASAARPSLQQHA